MSLPRPTDGKTGQRLWAIVRSFFCGITTNRSHERRYSIPNTMTKDTPPPSPTSTNTTLIEKGDVAPVSLLTWFGIPWEVAVDMFVLLAFIH